MPLPPGIKLIALTTKVPLQLSIRDGDRGWERARAQAAEHLAYQLFNTPGLIIQKEVETTLLERTFEFSVVAMHPRTLKEMMEAEDGKPDGTQILSDNEATPDRGLGLGQDGESGKSD